MQNFLHIFHVALTPLLSGRYQEQHEKLNSKNDNEGHTTTNSLQNLRRDHLKVVQKETQTKVERSKFLPFPEPFPVTLQQKEC